MIKKINNLKKSPIMILSYGTIISNLIPLILQPFLTRLISPEILGEYNLVISLANLIIPISSLKLYQLIITAESEDESKEISQMSINTVLIIFLLYLLIISTTYIFRQGIFYEIGLISFFIPFIVLVDGLYFVLTSIFNRNNNYQTMAVSEIIRNGFRGILQLIFALLKMDLIGQIISHIISPLIVVYYSVKELKTTLFSGNWISITQTVKKYLKYKNQILFSVPGQFINSYSYTLILLSITDLFSAKEVGYYSISMKVLGVPLVLISANISKIYLQRMSSKQKNNENLFTEYKKILLYLLILSTLGFGVLAIVAPWGSEILFGEGYRTAGQYISVLSIMFMFRFISSSLTGTYVIFNKQYKEVGFQLLLICGGALSYFIAKTYLFSTIEYLTIVSIIYGLIYFVIVLDITLMIYKKQIVN